MKTNNVFTLCSLSIALVLSTSLIAREPRATVLHGLAYADSANITVSAIVQTKGRRKEKVSVVEPSAFYPKQIEKLDYFYVGDRVVIDKPLLTNGGDVLIVGKRPAKSSTRTRLLA